MSNLDPVQAFLKSKCSFPEESTYFNLFPCCVRTPFFSNKSNWELENYAINEKVSEKNKVSNLTEDEINKLKDEAITVKEHFNKVIKLKFDIVFIYLKKEPLFKVFHAKSLNNELSSL